MELKKIKDLEEWISSSVKMVEEVCLKKNGIVNIALSGGNTPKPIYKALAKSNIDFSKVVLYLVDERYVPRDHPDSNYKMINEALLLNVEGEKPAIKIFDTTIPIEESIKNYEQEINDIEFDFMFLGIGPDGHFASLFPHSKALESRDKVAHSQTDHFVVEDRLTMTKIPILKSEKILVLMKGESKEEIINEVINSDKSYQDLPAKVLLDHSNIYLFYLTK